MVEASIRLPWNKLEMDFCRAVDSKMEMVEEDEDTQRAEFGKSAYDSINVLVNIFYVWLNFCQWA